MKISKGYGFEDLFEPQAEQIGFYKAEKKPFICAIHYYGDGNMYATFSNEYQVKTVEDNGHGKGVGNSTVLINMESIEVGETIWYFTDYPIESMNDYANTTILETSLAWDFCKFFPYSSCPQDLAESVISIAQMLDKEQGCEIVKLRLNKKEITFYHENVELVEKLIAINTKVGNIESHKEVKTAAGVTNHVIILRLPDDKEE